MPSWEAWVQIPNGLIKRGGEVQALQGQVNRIVLIKVENVLREQMSVIS
jgi:hypothetical protein